eukprot:65135-Chlamydomonas_euryale.AAC.2
MALDTMNHPFSCPTPHTSSLADARQHVPAELQVRVDLGLRARHAHMAFIDTQAAWPAEQSAGGGWAKDM